MLPFADQLEEHGRLKHFTVLADAISQAKDAMEFVSDQRAVERFDHMVEHILVQAYRGDRPMNQLAERVTAALEMFPVPRREPGTDESGEWTAVEEQPDDESGTYDTKVSGTYEKYESGKIKLDDQPHPTGWGEKTGS